MSESSAGEGLPAALPPLSRGEFVAMMAMIVSLLAMALDSMLPALPEIASDLGANGENQAQLIISVMFLGFATGQVFCGPASDSFGRKPVIHAGVAIFLAGCGLSYFADGFEVMLTGRVLQGFGAAPARIVSIALVRDQYAGRAMARIMSLIMAVFILVPAFAPAVGQGILLVSGWRSIFGFLVVHALLATTWFGLRQPETLLPERRTPFSLLTILRGVLEVCRTRVAIGYTIAAGIVFGGFVGYLTSAQQMFQEVYGVGKMFPVYFGSLALSVGVASVINSKFVERFGMQRLSGTALVVMALTAWAYVAYAWHTGGVPPFPSFMGFLVVTFMCVGVLFGNFNAMAMEPLGHIAGVGAAVVGSISTFISMALGTLIGQAYDRTVLPLVIGFGILSALSFGVMAWTERGRN